MTRDGFVVASYSRASILLAYLILFALIAAGLVALGTLARLVLWLFLLGWG